MSVALKTSRSLFVSVAVLRMPRCPATMCASFREGVKWQIRVMPRFLADWPIRMSSVSTVVLPSGKGRLPSVAVPLAPLYAS